MVYDVVDHSIKSLLNPELTASWEKGLTYVAEGSITSDEYMRKLDQFVTSRTVGVKGLNNQYQLRACYDRAAGFYKSSERNQGNQGGTAKRSSTKSSAVKSSAGTKKSPAGKKKSTEK